MEIRGIVIDTFKKALDRDIIVYDDSANSGELTSRLLWLMQRTAINLFLGKIIEYRIDRECVPSEVLSMNVPSYIHMYSPSTEELLEIDRGAMLAYQDRFIVIGITETGEYILGSC